MPTAADLMPLLPELVLVGAAFAWLMLDLFLDSRRRVITHILSIATLVVVIAMIGTGVGGHGTVLAGMFVRDTAADVMKVAICVTSVFALIYGWPYLRQRNLYQGEIAVLMLFAIAGMMLLVSAGSLVMVYLGLEMLALCSYALVAVDRDSPIASEAAIKYFVLGSMASGLILYGLSLIYGATGTLDLAAIGVAASTGSQTTLLVTGVVFAVAGIASSSAQLHSICGCRTSTTVRRRRSRCSSVPHPSWPISVWPTACWKRAPARSTTAGACCWPRWRSPRW
jgi:NADH-quinone oxidoreductase subunit N